IPGGRGNFIGFSRFNGVSVSSGAIAFTGAGTDLQGGIYLYKIGRLASILQTGGVLDGKRIQVVPELCPECFPEWWSSIPPLSMDWEGFDGNQLTFLVGFPDQTSGIYLATIAVADSDGDGVPDDRDQCPNTPQGA